MEPRRRAGAEETNCSRRKIPLPRRLGVSDREGLAGSDLGEARLVSQECFGHFA